MQRHIGKRISSLRRLRGLSQEALSFDCGLHRTYISQVERGVINPTIGNLKRIADALATPCWKLIEPL
ncbi:MAG: helix-turn-helix transcriptional regulator [Sphingomonadaceae bacterium]|nr:helix-turn-helix transcriptional regulator [Sphingomonadaceae bacterium]